MFLIFCATLSSFSDTLYMKAFINEPYHLCAAAVYGKTMKQIDHHNLTVSAVSGDMDAFCELYDLYKLRMYKYARYRLGNDQDAEDAVSECFLSAWKQIGSLRDPDAFAGWIFTILSGCCGKIIGRQIEGRTALQAEGISVTQTEGRERSALPDPVGHGSAELRLILSEALEKISETDRNIVLLSVVGGFKSNEIASITGLKPGSVRSRLSRALAKMREYLEH